MIRGDRMNNYQRKQREIQDAVYSAGPVFNLVEDVSGLTVEYNGRPVYTVDPYVSVDVGALTETLESQRSTEWKPCAENLYGMEFTREFERLDDAVRGSDRLHTPEEESLANLERAHYAGLSQEVLYGVDGEQAHYGQLAREMMGYQPAA